MFNPLDEIQKPFVQRLLILVLLALLALLLVWATLFSCPPEKNPVGPLEGYADTLPTPTQPAPFEEQFPCFLITSERCSGYGSESAVVAGVVFRSDEGERTGRHPWAK